MSKFNAELIDSFADKLLIGLTREENQLVLEEFEFIDSHIDLLNEIDNLSKVEPMTHALDDFTFSLRDDVATPSIPVTELLANASVVRDREVEVPKVVGE